MFVTKKKHKQKNKKQEKQIFTWYVQTYVQAGKAGIEQ